MLRLDLKDIDDTVLFTNPVNGIEIHKITDRFSVGEQEKSGLRLSFATCGSCELMHTVVWYSDPESRNTAYEYVLAKITECLFPQVEEVIGPNVTEDDPIDSVAFTYDGKTKHCLSCRYCDCSREYCSMKGNDVDIHDPACEYYEPC